MKSLKIKVKKRPLIIMNRCPTISLNKITTIVVVLLIFSLVPIKTAFAVSI